MSIAFAGGEGAAGAARRALEGLAGRLKPAVYDDARLLVTELVTNSVRHAGAGVGATLCLTVAVSRETLRAEVHDDGAPFDPRPADSGHPGDEGWGLVLVDRIADRWGVDGERGKRVWFELDGTRDPHPRSSHA